jgi:hypothetical protein
MLDQSFSPENLFRIYCIENRKGSFRSSFYSKRYKEKQEEAKEKWLEIVEFKSNNKGKWDDEQFTAYKTLNEEKTVLDKEKENILREELEAVSKKISKDKYEFNLTEKIHKGKSVYIVGDDNEEMTSFFAMKQLQYNIQRTFKVKQANRFEIVKQVKSILEDNFPKIILRTDIKSFYENVPQKLLKEKIYGNALLNAQSKKLINQLFYLYNAKKRGKGIQEERDEEKGIPRGAGVSAYLAEVYMRDVDTRIKELPRVTYYARYVDDIIVIFTPNKKSENRNYKDEVRTEIEKVGLKINDEKTPEPINLLNSQGRDLQFLGYKFLYNEKKFDRVTISDKRLEKIKGRIFQSFIFYKINQTIPTIRQKAKWLLIHQISFLTGNTRLIHNKSNILIGIYYSNSLLNDNDKVLTDLDEFLNKYIKNYIVEDDELKQRLFEFSFTEGFRTKRYARFKTSRVPDFRPKKLKEERKNATGVEKILANWTD